MAKVILREGEDLTAALTRFKGMVKKDGILFDYRKKIFFKSKSEKREEKHQRAEQRKTAKQRQARDR